MADLNIQLILRLVDRATAPARAAMRAVERLGGEGVMRQAAQVQRGAGLMRDGLGQVGGAALRTGAVLAGYAGTMSLIAGAFIRPAAQFERFQVQLTSLEGSAEGASRAMRWIEDFATRTPLQLDETVEAYAKLRAFGLDPTKGSMQALVDTMAATGGGAEQLDGLVLALGQAWTKGKLQGEEALQMLERGVPVWDLLGKKMGKTAAELQDMASKGKLGRREIELLIEAMAEKNKGASANMARTFAGTLSNVQDHWGRFQRMVMASGVFDVLKGRLQQLLQTLDTMAADGRLQLWADRLARAILTVLDGIWAAGLWVRDTFVMVWPALDAFATAIGGWDVVGWAAGLVVFRGAILGLVTGFWTLAQGVVLVGQALVSAGALALANPLLLVLAAVAGAAFVIYRNWDGIAGYFADKIDRVRAAFDQGLLHGVLKTLSEFNPFLLMMDAAKGLFAYLTGWSFDEVTAAIRAAFDIDLFQAGVEMILSLWNGIKSVIGQLQAYVKEQLSGLIPEMPAWLKSMSGSGADAAATTPDNPAVEMGQRALGGPVRAGAVYRWQEEGRELFVPRVDGTVISNRALRGMQGGRPSTAIHLGGIAIHAAPGQSPADIARAVRRELAAVARERGFALDDGGAYA